MPLGKDRLRANAPLLAITVAATALMTCVSAPRVRPDPPPSSSGMVSARDGHLWLDGRRYRFIGVNVYSLASAPPDSGGFICGNALTDDDARELVREVATMGGNAGRQAHQVLDVEVRGKRGTVFKARLAQYLLGATPRERHDFATISRVPGDWERLLFEAKGVPS